MVMTICMAESMAIAKEEMSRREKSIMDYLPKEYIFKGENDFHIVLKRADSEEPRNR
jgi:hypothetical protein